MSKLISNLPWIIFGIWTIGFILNFLLSTGNQRRWLSVYSIFARYFIGLPGGIITFSALMSHSKAMFRVNQAEIGKKFRALAISFLAYGALAGLVVGRSNFFPSNIINRHEFYRITGFPVELGRTAAAVIITIIFSSLVKIFKWESDLRIDKLNQSKSISNERRKMAQELHDVVIQNLFAAGLEIEGLIESENDQSTKQTLQKIKENLNNQIQHIRDFIAKVSVKKMGIDDLRSKITEYIEKMQKLSEVKIDLIYRIPDITLGSLSSEKLTDVYYIIQEAISNALKHSGASLVTVIIECDLKSVDVSILDNGSGINIINNQNSRKYGMELMKERAESIRGILKIESDRDGTMINLRIPWEEYDNEGKGN